MSSGFTPQMRPCWILMNGLSICLVITPVLLSLPFSELFIKSTTFSLLFCFWRPYTVISSICKTLYLTINVSYVFCSSPCMLMHVCSFSMVSSPIGSIFLRHPAWSSASTLTYRSPLSLFSNSLFQFGYGFTQEAMVNCRFKFFLIILKIILMDCLLLHTNNWFRYLSSFRVS